MTPIKNQNEMFIHRSDHLKNHNRIHTGEWPFKCDFTGCNKLFTNADALKAHGPEHTGYQEYNCEVEGCVKTYPSRVRLQGGNSIKHFLA